MNDVVRHLDEGQDYHEMMKDAMKKTKGLESVAEMTLERNRVKIC